VAGLRYHGAGPADIQPEKQRHDKEQRVTPVRANRRAFLQKGAASPAKASIRRIKIFWPARTLRPRIDPDIGWQEDALSARPPANRMVAVPSRRLKM
jgi:hypothetical protein